MQTEPISCCFNTQKIILILEHKARLKMLQSDEGHYESRIKSTVHGIDMQVSVYSLYTNRLEISPSEAQQSDVFADMFESSNCTSWGGCGS